MLKYNFRIYYVEVIVNILFVVLITACVWLFFKSVNVGVNKKVMFVNASNVSIYVLFIVALSSSICAFLFFFIHLMRLLYLKEKKLLIKRVFLFLVWVVMFSTNAVLSYYNRLSQPHPLPDINGISFTGYSFSFSVIFVFLYYLILSKNEIQYFKEKINLNRSLVDELHEN